MPIYELQCNGCGIRFEELLKTVTDLENSVVCPKCGGSKISRIFSPFAMHFKKLGGITEPAGSDLGKCSGCSSTSCSSCGG